MFSHKCYPEVIIREDKSTFPKHHLVWCLVLKKQTKSVIHKTTHTANMQLQRTDQDLKIYNNIFQNQTESFSQLNTANLSPL